MTELVDFLKKSFALLKRKSNQVKVNDNHFEQLSVKKEEKIVHIRLKRKFPPSICPRRFKISEWELLSYNNG